MAQKSALENLLEAVPTKFRVLFSTYFVMCGLLSTFVMGGHLFESTAMEKLVMALQFDREKLPSIIGQLDLNFSEENINDLLNSRLLNAIIHFDKDHNGTIDGILNIGNATTVIPIFSGNRSNLDLHDYLEANITRVTLVLQAVPYIDPQCNLVHELELSTQLLEDGTYETIDTINHYTIESAEGDDVLINNIRGQEPYVINKQEEFNSLEDLPSELQVNIDGCIGAYNQIEG